jgi:hypothetical protein
MGQYYRPYLVEESTGKEIVLSRDIDGEYTLAKLMEHSWRKNPLMNAVSNMLYHNPHKVAWVGDYSDSKCEVYDKVWGEGVNTIGLNSVDFSLDGKFIVNHTKRSYLDCDAYKQRNNNEGWVIHPLSLLTVIGNGLGGGDYRGVYKDNIGDWYLDVLSIEDEVPEGYSDSDYDFYE